MFFVFSKILSFVITPVIWVLVLLIMTLVSKRDVRKKAYLIASLVLILFFSNSFIFNEVIRAWEVSPVIISKSDSVVYDAGIVLGGMLRYDEANDRIQFDKGSDRLLQAIELYKRGVIKKIIFSGGSGSILHPEAKEALFAQKFLLALGIPGQDILIETESRNTNENAKYTKQLVDKELPSGKFLLITSAFHMRRSVGCFNKAGMEVIPYPTDVIAHPRMFEFDIMFIPHIDALTGWNTLIHEITGYVVYDISGYL